MRQSTNTNSNRASLLSGFLTGAHSVQRRDIPEFGLDVIKDLSRKAFRELATFHSPKSRCLYSAPDRHGWVPCRESKGSVAYWLSLRPTEDESRLSHNRPYFSPPWSAQCGRAEHRRLTPQHRLGQSHIARLSSVYHNHIHKAEVFPDMLHEIRHLTLVSISVRFGGSRGGVNCFL